MSGKINSHSKLVERKADDPIEIKDLERVRVPFNPEHPSNALSPIVKTESGIINDPIY